MSSRSMQKRYIECPFCSGVLEPKLDRMTCPECHARFRYDDEMRSIFVDTGDLRLPIHGTVCPQCGLVQDEDMQSCVYCDCELSSTVQ